MFGVFFTTKVNSEQQMEWMNWLQGQITMYCHSTVSRFHEWKFTIRINRFALSITRSILTRGHICYSNKLNESKSVNTIWQVYVDNIYL